MLAMFVQNLDFESTTPIVKGLSCGCRVPWPIACLSHHAPECECSGRLRRQPLVNRPVRLLNGAERRATSPAARVSLLGARCRCWGRVAGITHGGTAAGGIKWARGGYRRIRTVPDEISARTSSGFSERSSKAGRSRPPKVGWSRASRSSLPAMLGIASCHRLLVWNGGHPRRSRRTRPRAGRRDHHHPDHRHGSLGADPLSGRDPGVRRRRPSHRQRHRPTRSRPASAIARRQSWSRTCSAIPARWPRSWRWPRGTACR